VQFPSNSTFKVFFEEGRGDEIGNEDGNGNITMAECDTSTEGLRRIDFVRQYTVPIRSNLKIEGLDDSTESTSATRL
jgi:hypothetical protein